MKNWELPEEHGNMLLKSGVNIQLLQPMAEGISRIRPLARPYLPEVLAIVPKIVASALEVWKSTGAGDSAQGMARYKQTMLEYCAKVVQAAGIQRRTILEVHEDLYRATTQALLSGGNVPATEWWRHGLEGSDIGGAFLRLPLASFWGVKPVTVWDATSDYTDMPGVFTLVTRELEHAIKAGNTMFVPYMKAGYGKGQFGITYIKWVGLCQCLVAEHGGKTAQTPEYALYMLTPQALKDLSSQWNTPAGGPGAPMPKDWLNGFQCGNLLDAAHGRQLIVYNKKAQQAAAGGTGGTFSSSFTTTRTKKAEGGPQVEYGTNFQHEWPVPDATSVSLFKQWDDILHIPTRAEAWVVCLQAAGPVPVAYAGRNEIDNLPATVRDMARQFLAQSQAAATGMAPPAGAFGAPSTTFSAAPGAPAPLMTPPAMGAPAAPAAPTLPAAFTLPAAPAAAPQTVPQIPTGPAPVAPQIPQLAAAMAPAAMAPQVAPQIPAFPGAAAPAAPAAPAATAPTPQTFAQAFTAPAPAAPQVPTGDMIPQIPEGVDLPTEAQMAAATAGAPSAPAVAGESAGVDSAIADLARSLEAGHSGPGF